MTTKVKALREAVGEPLAWYVRCDDCGKGRVLEQEIVYLADSKHIPALVKVFICGHCQHRGMTAVPLVSIAAICDKLELTWEMVDDAAMFEEVAQGATTIANAIVTLLEAAGRERE
jgi:hypothetical protein